MCIRKNFFFTVLAISILLWCSFLAAQEIPELPKEKIIDDAIMLSGLDQKYMEKAIAFTEAETGGKIALIVLEKFPFPGYEKAFSIKAAEKWEYDLTSKVLILVYCEQKRVLFFEVGDDWKNIFDEATIKNIRDGMYPFRRQGNQSRSILYAIGRIQKILTGKEMEKMPVPPTPKKYWKYQNTLIWTAITVFFIILGIIIYWIYKTPSRFKEGFIDRE